MNVLCKRSSRKKVLGCITRLEMVRFLAAPPDLPVNRASHPQCLPVEVGVFGCRKLLCHVCFSLLNPQPHTLISLSFCLSASRKRIAGHFPELAFFAHRHQPSKLVIIIHNNNIIMMEGLNTKTPNNNIIIMVVIAITRVYKWGAGTSRSSCRVLCL